LADIPPNLVTVGNVNGQACHLHPDRAGDFGIIRDPLTTLPYNDLSPDSATAEGCAK